VHLDHQMQPVVYWELVIIDTAASCRTSGLMQQNLRGSGDLWVGRWIEELTACLVTARAEARKNLGTGVELGHLSEAETE